MARYRPLTEFRNYTYVLQNQSNLRKGLSVEFILPSSILLILFQLPQMLNLHSQANGGCVPRVRKVSKRSNDLHVYGYKQQPAETTKLTLACMFVRICATNMPKKC